MQITITALLQSRETQKHIHVNNQIFNSAKQVPTIQLSRDGFISLVYGLKVRAHITEYNSYYFSLPLKSLALSHHLRFSNDVRHTYRKVNRY